MTNFLVSLAVSLSVAAVTVWLSLRRFRTERWWDQKVEAYSRIPTPFTRSPITPVPGPRQSLATALGLFIGAPVVGAWVVLFVAPRTIRWVRDGFSTQSRH